MKRIKATAFGRPLRRVIDAVRGRIELGFVPPANYAMQNYRRMRFLHHQIVAHAHPSSGVALEIGCFEGGSTVVLARACLRRGIGAIFAIDLFVGTPGWGQTRDTETIAAERIRRHDLAEHVGLIRADSQSYPWERPIDVLHIDADHSYEAVRDDIAKYVPFLTDRGLVIFDDYDREHPGVQRAVHEFLACSPEYQVVGVSYEGNQFGSLCLQRGAAPEI